MTPESIAYQAEGLAAYMEKGGSAARWFESKALAPCDAEAIGCELLRLHGEEQGALVAELRAHIARMIRRGRANGRASRGRTRPDTETMDLRVPMR